METPLKAQSGNEHLKIDSPALLVQTQHLTSEVVDSILFASEVASTGYGYEVIKQNHPMFFWNNVRSNN